MLLREFFPLHCILWHHFLLIKCCSFPNVWSALFIIYCNSVLLSIACSNLTVLRPFFFFFLDILLSGIDMKRAICRTTHSVVWYQFSCICSYDRRHVGLAKMTKVGMPVIPTKSLRIALFIAYGNLCGEQYGCATNWSCALWYYKGAYNGRGGVVPPLVLIHSWSHLSKERKERKLVQSSPKSLSPPI